MRTGGGERRAFITWNVDGTVDGGGDGDRERIIQINVAVWSQKLHISRFVNISGTLWASTVASFTLGTRLGMNS